MRKILLALALCFLPTLAQAACTGIFASGSICGSLTGGPPIEIPAASVPSALSLTSAHIYVGNASNRAADVAPSGAGDCTFTISNAGVFTYTCTKTNGVSFGSLATQSSVLTGQLPSPFTNGTARGNTSSFVTYTGTTPVAGHIATYDASGNVQDGGASTGTISACTGVTSGTCPPPFGLQNCSLAVSVAGNNVTYALKDNAGNDPTVSSPCNIYHRSATLGSGAWTQVTAASAASFTANSGSTFGLTNTAATCSAASSCPFRHWVVGIDTGNGLALGIVALTNASGILPLNEGILLSTTGCNACANATGIGITYSNSALANRPFVILGYAEWGSGLASAGAYATTPTVIQTMGPGVRKPGDVIQRISPAFGTLTVVSVVGGSFANSSATGLTANITPTSSANPVRATFNTTASNSAGAGFTHSCQISRGGNATGPVAKSTSGNASTGNGIALTNYYDTPGVTSQQTYLLRCWTSGGTLSVPAVNSDSGVEELVEIQG